MDNKIKKLLYYCLEDSSTEEIFKIESQIFIITSKSLLPFENKVGCGIHYKRFIKELEYLNYYKNGLSKSYEALISTKKQSKTYDDLIEYKILPIIISNSELNIAIEESLKIVLFFTLDYKSIVESIFLSRLLFDYLLGIEDYELLIQNIKESIINFSIKNFFIKHYKKELNKEYLLKIEKERIDFLLKLNTLESINIKNSKIYNYIINNHTHSKKFNNNNKLIIDNFASYFIKLRQGIISPEKIKIDLNDIKDLKQFNNTKIFNNPILGVCKVLEDNNDYSIIQTKTGIIKVKK